jgi:hypothetical protein
MTTPTTGTAPLIERLMKSISAVFTTNELQLALWDMRRSDVRDALTAALGDGIWIERIRNQINYLDAVVEYDVRGNAELRQGIADLRSLLNDAFTGPGIWIEREQARERLARRFAERMFDPPWDALSKASKGRSYDWADEQIAALTGEKRP